MNMMIKGKEDLLAHAYGAPATEEAIVRLCQVAVENARRGDIEAACALADEALKLYRNRGGQP
jgi:hypothetical protein